MNPRPFFVEVEFSDEPAREKPPAQSPYDIIEHPFRVIVHDSEFHVLKFGTTAIGSTKDPLSLAKLFVRTTLSWASAIIINRASLSIVDTLVRNVEDQHASRSSYPSPPDTETPPTGNPAVSDNDPPAPRNPHD